jgi:hypothetical protein
MNRLLFFAITFACMLAGKLAFTQVKSEAVLVNRLLICLSKADDSLYGSLFPKYQMLAETAFKAATKDEQDQQRRHNILSDPEKLRQFDPEYNSQIPISFREILIKGLDSGLHWSDILIVRFELEKTPLPKELVGLEKVVSINLEGYVFIQDLLTRKTFAIPVKSIFCIKDQWYGGHVLDILEADSKEDYVVKKAREKEWLERVRIALLNGDSSLLERKQPKLTIDEEEEQPKMRTEVLERRLFKGAFDNEIPVELYLRSLKGSCPEAACAWEALYKIGDADSYIKLEVTRSADGRYIFTEEDVGVMELRLTGSHFQGSWISFKDKTEYDAMLVEKKEIKNRKLFELDDIIENGEQVSDEY